MTATQQRRLPQGGSATAPPQQHPQSLMDQVLALPVAQRFKQLDDALQARIGQIEELLPSNMRGQAARLAKRAILTLNRKADQYADVTPQSFVRCVLEAAELGLAIDGKLAHAVVFNNKVRVNGVEKWQKEAQLMIDYKGLIAVARRGGLIKDCYAMLVREGDAFDCWIEDGDHRMIHRPDLAGAGKIIGAYAVLKLAGGTWRHEWMSMDDIDAVRKRSKSWTGGKGPSGPWVTDDGEMRKKTVLRRVLKLFCEDPAVVRAMEVEEDDYEETVERVAAYAPPRNGRTATELLTSPVGPEAPIATPAALEDAPEDASDNPDADTPPATTADGELPYGSPDELADDIREHIRQAATVKALEKVGKTLKEQAAALGTVLHGGLVQTFQEKMKVLTKP